MNVNDGLHGLPEALGVSQTSRVSPAQQKSQVDISSPASGVHQDHTEVSTAATLAHRAMSLPDVRMDKVAAVQQALANGTYQVDPADVAGKIVNRMMGE